MERQPHATPGATGPAPSHRWAPRLWRLYALASLVPLAVFAGLLIGPDAQEPFDPLMAVDFGAFYAAAGMVRDGDAPHLGEMEAQRAAQRRVQEDESTGWRWYNAFPYPPVTSLLTAPLAALPLRAAYWVWAALGLGAAAVACWLLARTFCPELPLAATLILVAFEPIWDVAWWGQIDSLMLLPVAAAVVLLHRGTGPPAHDPADRRSRDLAAGALLGVLALKPIFVPLPLLVLLWGRPLAALGMVLSGLGLGLASVALVGVDGVADYVDLARFYQAFSGSPAIVEWRMYNLRGAAIRLGWGWSEGLQLAVVLAASLALAVASVVAAACAIRRGRNADLASGAVVLATILTAYHVHVQSLVYLVIPIALWLRRSLRAPSALQALLWAVPVVAIHGAAALLRPQQPSPAASETRIETLLTTCLLAALLASLALLGVAAKARRSGQPNRSPTAPAGFTE